MRMVGAVYDRPYFGQGKLFKRHAQNTLSAPGAEFALDVSSHNVLFCKPRRAGPAAACTQEIKGIYNLEGLSPAVGCSL